MQSLYWDLILERDTVTDSVQGWSVGLTPGNVTQARPLAREGWPAEESGQPIACGHLTTATARCLQWLFTLLD